MNELEIKVTISHRYGRWTMLGTRGTGEFVGGGGGKKMETLFEEADPTPERLIEVADALGEDASRVLRERFREMAESAEEALASAHQDAERAATSTRERIASKSVIAHEARRIAEQFPTLVESSDIPF